MPTTNVSKPDRSETVDLSSNRGAEEDDAESNTSPSLCSFNTAYNNSAGREDCGDRFEAAHSRSIADSDFDFFYRDRNSDRGTHRDGDRDCYGRPDHHTAATDRDGDCDTDSANQDGDRDRHGDCGTGFDHLHRLGYYHLESTRITVPSNVQNGDLILAFYSYWYTASATAPSGWQLLQTSASTSSGIESVWYRFANGDTPGASYTWSFSGTPYESGGVLAYRGVNPNTPQDGACVTHGSSTAPSLCSFTTAYSNDRYVGLYTTERTSLVDPTDVTAELVTRYQAGSHFGFGAPDTTSRAAHAVPGDLKAGYPSGVYFGVSAGVDKGGSYCGP